MSAKATDVELNVWQNDSVECRTNKGLSVCFRHSDQREKLFEKSLRRLGCVPNHELDTVKIAREDGFKTVAQRWKQFDSHVRISKSETELMVKSNVAITFFALKNASRCHFHLRNRLNQVVLDSLWPVETIYKDCFQPLGETIFLFKTTSARAKMFARLNSKSISHSGFRSARSLKTNCARHVQVGFHYQKSNRKEF